MKIDEKWKPLVQVSDFVQRHTQNVSNVYDYNEINDLFNDNSLYTAYFKNDNFIRNTHINSAYLPDENRIHIVNTDYENSDYSENVYTCRFSSDNGTINKYLNEFDYNRRAETFNFVVKYDEFEDTICLPQIIVFNKLSRSYSTVTGITNILNLNRVDNYVVSISLQTVEKKTNSQYANNASFALGCKDDNYFLTAGFTYPEIRLNKYTYQVLEIANPDLNYSYHIPPEGILINPNIKYGQVTKINDTYIVKLEYNTNTDAIHLLLSIDDVEKYLAYCNVCYIDENSTKVKYVSECVNNELTGKLLEYNVWKTSDNTNNNSYDNTPVPVVPVADEKDNVTNMELSYLLVQNTAPFSRYYICTPQQLASLSVNIATSETIPEGLNVFDNIVFLQCYPVDLIDRFLTNNAEIIIANWPSGVNALRTTSQITVSPAYYIDIVRHYNDFRDFAPVSKYELYLPMFGMYQLPDYCVNCSVKIQILYDLISCEMIYHISVSDRQKQNYTLIDKVKCVLGTSISFKSENNSMKLLENRQNILNTINATTAFVSSLATKNVSGTISATTNLANSFTNDAIINNKSRTQTVGQNTSVACFNDVSSIYLYITRTETKIPDDFRKTIGYLFDSEDVIENHTGLCICDNVELNNINCTLSEKVLIKSILESYFSI